MDETKSGNFDININEKIAGIQAEEQTKIFESEKAQRKDDLKSYVKNCFAASVQWRKTSFEDNWDKWHRNARSIYDPDIKAKKESWQITMFVPLTLSHKERAKAQIFKTLIGTNPHFDIDIRPGGDTNQAEMVKDLILYYMDKSRFELGFNDKIDQAATYGTGIAKAYWLTLKEKRKIKEPVYPPQGIIEKLQSTITGKKSKPLAYQEVEREIETFDGIIYSHVDIHDIFPDPKDPTMHKSWVIHRTSMSYGELVAGANKGYYDKEAVDRLSDVKESEQPEQDKSTEKQDIGETLPSIPRTDYSKPHTILEFWGRLPRKWVYAEKSFNADKGNEIIPAKCLMAAEGNEFLSIDENNSYSGDSPIIKGDYIRVPGSHFGMGIPELLFGIQEELNELRNQRVDNGVIAMNQMAAISEDAIIDENDLISKPGGCVRIKGRRQGGFEDIRAAIMPLPLGTVQSFGYQETMELEREAQEITGVTRVTMGVGGQFAKDTNQTASGMQMLRQTSLELMSYYANILELSAFIETLRHFYVLIYKNITPEKLEKILGKERAEKFILQPIEEMEQFYKFKPTGTYTMTNKLLKAQSLMQFKALYENAPFMKPIALAKRIARLLDIDDPDEIMMTDEEFQGKMVELQQQAGLEGSMPPQGQMSQEGPMPQEGGPIQEPMPGGGIA